MFLKTAQFFVGLFVFSQNKEIIEKQNIIKCLANLIYSLMRKSVPDDNFKVRDADLSSKQWSLFTFKMIIDKN